MKITGGVGGVRVGAPTLGVLTIPVGETLSNILPVSALVGAPLGADLALYYVSGPGGVVVNLLGEPEADFPIPDGIEGDWPFLYLSFYPGADSGASLTTNRQALMQVAPQWRACTRIAAHAGAAIVGTPLVLHVRAS